MSALDEHFPEATERNEQAVDAFKEHGLAVNLNNWRCKENLWGILDAFVAEYPNLIITARDRTTNYAATREIIQIIGESDGPEFIRRAARHRRKKQLEVGSIYSLIQYRLVWFKREEDTSKYLEGVDDG